MTDRNRELVPDNWSLRSMRKNADHLAFVRKDGIQKDLGSIPL